MRAVLNTRTAASGLTCLIWRAAPRGPIIDSRGIILSVKAGSTSVAHVRDRRGVVERETAEIGGLSA